MSNIAILKPHTYSEWLTTNFWFSPGQDTIGPGLSRHRAMILYNVGLQRNSDVWVDEYQRILPNTEVEVRFGLLPVEYRHWDILCDRLACVGSRLKSWQSTHPHLEEWLGVYWNPEDALPQLVFQGQAIPKAQLDGLPTSVPIVCISDGYEMQPQSRTLSLIPAELSDSGAYIPGTLQRIRIIHTTRG
jgi:hypothetical protein